MRLKSPLMCSEGSASTALACGNALGGLTGQAFNDEFDDEFDDPAPQVQAEAVEAAAVPEAAGDAGAPGPVAAAEVPAAMNAVFGGFARIGGAVQRAVQHLLGRDGEH